MKHGGNREAGRLLHRCGVKQDRVRRIAITRPRVSISRVAGFYDGGRHAAMNDRLQDIEQSLVESFRNYGGINHLDGVNLPSREAVVAVTRDLLRLMFPGFYDKDPIHSNQLTEYTSELVSSLARRLENEIYRSLE